MADISTELQKIVDAVYGEDVRWSIHDAIALINDVSEVVISAGTAVSSASSSSTGFYKDSLYINTNTCDLWKCTGTDTWALVGNLQGIGITNIAKTGASGLVDTYTITLSDGNSYTFEVTNGKNGTTWYKGTGISGRSVNPTVYSGSGVANAQENDFYLNTAEQAVYHCTLGGIPSVATWVYDFDLSGGGGYGAGNGIDITGTTISLDADLDDLNDVAITSPADGQLITYDVNAGKFVNKNPDKSYVRYAGAINFADLVTYASTYLTADYEDAFFLLRTSGTIGSGEASAYWSSNFTDGDVIPVDSHIAVININRGTMNPAVYKYDDFGGFVDISGKADRTEIIHWVDATLTSGQSSYTVNNSLFKTTSRIVQILADDGGSYSSISVANGSCTITFPSALTQNKNISIGISNAPSA